MEGADLHGANLEGAVLAQANLQRANLAGAHLEGADLAGASLKGVTFRKPWPFEEFRAGGQGDGGLFEEAHLEVAVTDGTTDWPDGFDWKAAGVVRY